jgi:hypothetical protein
MSACDEPIYLRQLRDIALGKAPKLSADAIKQHYVPSFLLARWATPQNRRGKLTQLNVTSGMVESRKAGNVATEPELYTIDANTPSPNRSIEALLGLFETNAADPIKNLATLPTTISDNDRLTIAMFLAFQQGRTPTGLTEHLHVAQMAVERSLHEFLRDRDKVAAYVRAHINPNTRDNDIKAWATSEIKAFKSGTRFIEMPPEAPFQAMLKSVSPVASCVASLDWTLLESARGEFVTNDRGLAMHDPELRDGQGHAWSSSPAAETTFPVAPNTCLKLTPGNAGFSVRQATADDVVEINLRTYGWADKLIFGTDAEAVKGVRQSALTEPTKVVKPQVPKWTGEVRFRTPSP